MFVKVSALGEVANFGTFYFLLKIKILAKREREPTTIFAIVRNRCYAFGKIFGLNFYYISFIASI